MSPSQDKTSQPKSVQHRVGTTAGNALFRTLAGLAALLVLVVLALQLVSWNFLKGPISERVRTATGRELVISGDISVNLLPRPQITLYDLSFANAGWAQTPDMVSVRRVQLTPALGELFAGDLAFDHVDINGLTVNLENREQQSGNWRLPAMTRAEQQGAAGDADPAGAGGQDSAANEAAVPFVVRQLQLSEAEISYWPAGTEDPHVLSLESLAFSDDRLTLQATADVVAGDGYLDLPVALSASVVTGFSDNHWQLNDIEAQLDNTAFNGRLGWNAGVQPPVLSAQLHSPEINVSDIADRLPESQERSDRGQIAIPVLPTLAGDVELRVDKLTVQSAMLSNTEIHVLADAQQLALENLSFDVADGRVETTASLTSNAGFVQAQADIQIQDVDLYRLGIGEQAGQNFTAEIVAGIERLEQGNPVDLATFLQRLHIEQAQASYQAPNLDAEMSLALTATTDTPEPVLSITGQFRDQPVDMTLQGAPLAELADGLADYPLQGQVHSGQLSVQADTRLGALLTPATFAMDFIIEGDDAQSLETWVGAVLPPLPAFRVAGRLSREQQQWSITELDASIGVTELNGQLQYLAGDRPGLQAELEAGRIELARFMESRTASEDPGGANPAGNPVSVKQAGADSPLAVLRRFDARLNLHVDTLALPDRTALTDLQLTARLDDGNVDVQTLSFQVANGSWSSSMALDATGAPASGVIEAEFDNIALSRFGASFSAIEDRLGTMSGALHLEITESLAVDQAENLLLPFIGRLTVQPSWLSFTDREVGTDMTLNMRTRGLDAGEQAFHIDGDGRYDGEVFSLRFRGDRLLDVRRSDLPYNIDLLVNVVDTRIEVMGSVLRPLALKGLNLRLDMEGPSPHRLSRLLDIPLPELPSYAISGDLDLDAQRWTLSNMSGTVGDSDVGGHLALDTGARLPHISGELQSQSLDIADLGLLLGAERGTADSAGRRFILPSEPVVTSAWQQLSADIQYRGASVRAANIPLSDMMVDFVLADGHGHFDPVRFGVGDGRVDFNLDLDSTPDTPTGTMQLEVRSVDLQKALGDWSLADGSVGTVGAQGKLWLTGASVAELLGSADGGLVMLMTEGRLDALLVELAGLDVAQVFSSWISNREAIPIRCSYVDLQTRDGIANIDTLAVDTDDTLFSGTGTVNMDSEQVDITLHAYPKDFSVLSVNAPLQLGGTFVDLEANLPTGDIGQQVAASAALAAVAAPVAALAPLLDLGPGENSPYCNGLASRTLDAFGDAQ